jgi:hypothetical protein
MERIADYLKRYAWLPRSVRNLSIKRLVKDAIHTRNVFQEKMSTLLNGDPQVKGFKRKRLLPKLRYYAGRLSYLAVPDVLSSLASSLVSYPEMLLESAVMNTIKSRDVTSLLRFGANAVQAGAQIMRNLGGSVNYASDVLGDVELQGLAILRLNGIKVAFSDQLSDRVLSDQLNQFANGGNPIALMSSDNLFLKEIACLRGVVNLFRHQALLNTAFDRDEHLVFDVINQLRDSSYF